jgi:membrane protease YdiL (CAAX protease family)
VWHGGSAASAPADRGWFPDIRTLRWPAALLAVGTVVLLVAGNLASSALADQARLAAGLIGLAVLALNTIGFPLVGVVASKRWGSGRVARDLGLHFRPVDLVLGIGGAVAMFTTVVVSGVILQAIRVPQTSNLDEYGTHPSAALIVFLLVLAGVIAPVVEEILFRGVLLRALTDRWSIPMAVVGQGAIFGCAHLLWDGGWGNVGLIVPLAFVGMLLGFLARWTGRLGTSMVAHCAFNVAQVLLYATIGSH